MNLDNGCPMSLAMIRQEMVTFKTTFKRVTAGGWNLKKVVAVGTTGNLTVSVTETIERTMTDGVG